VIEMKNEEQLFNLVVVGKRISHFYGLTWIQVEELAWAMAAGKVDSIRCTGSMSTTVYKNGTVFIQTPA
jgi:hypothetical protein